MISPPIYLNNAATGYPKPESVLNAVAEYLHHSPALNGRSSGQTDDIITCCRQKLATLFHAPEPNQIVFTAGATEALNLAILGSRFKNAHIITTNTEHNSVLRPLYKLVEDGLIELTIVPCNSQGDIATHDVSTAIRENTAALIINHCSNVTGHVIPLKPYAQIAHDIGALFIVDASQSAGIYPIDVLDDEIDMLAFTGHKALHGLPGIGGLYIKKELWPTPLKFGGTGVKSQILTQPHMMPLYYEAGTPNTPGIVSLLAGINFITTTGMDKIRKHKENLMALFYNELKEEAGLIFYPSNNNHLHSTMISFNIKDFNAQDLAYILEQSFHIVLRAGLHCAPLIHQALGSYPNGTVRLSPSYFTIADDIHQTIKAIKEILAAT